MGSSPRAALLNELIKAETPAGRTRRRCTAGRRTAAPHGQPLTASSASIDGYVFGNRYVFGDLPPGLAD